MIYLFSRNTIVIFHFQPSKNWDIYLCNVWDINQFPHYVSPLKSDSHLTLPLNTGGQLSYRLSCLWSYLVSKWIFGFPPSISRISRPNECLVSMTKLEVGIPSHTNTAVLTGVTKQLLLRESKVQKMITYCLQPKKHEIGA